MTELVLKVSKSELAVLQAAADERGTSVKKFVRMAAFATAAPVIAQRVERLSRTQDEGD